MGAMQHFTSRFKSRLVEMATGEPDMPSRCLAISILSILDQHGLLDSVHRGELVRLIYHEDFRVRRAIGRFFGSVLQEIYDDRRMKMNAHTSSSQANLQPKHQLVQDAEKRLGFKCLAHLLIRCGRTRTLNLDELEGEDDESESESSDHLSNEVKVDEQADLTGHLGYLPRHPEKGRVALAVECLWDEVELIRDWQAMADYLLLDHSAVASSDQANQTLTASRNRTVSVARVQGGPADSEEEEVMAVDEVSRLSEAEESLLVEIFVATLRKAGSVLTSEETLAIKKRKRKLLKRKKTVMTDEEEDSGEAASENGEEEERVAEKEMMEENSNQAEITRVMMKVLPRLTLKYTTDPIRLSEVLRIPKLMSLRLYLEVRMVSVSQNSFLMMCDSN